MKTIITLLVLAMSLAVSTPASAASSTKAVRKGKLVHVVSFKFKPTASQTDIDKLVDAFSALPGKIKQIKTYEWGTNVSPEKHDKGFTHCFILTFKSDKDRDEYLVHPDHKDFGKLVGPVVADVFVVDYWARK
ncbi:MAG: Dabb family protein [Verrucomicrobia bacterium]|nr:Dabb family protein [Verrucomicrobiota bacterium]